VSLLFAVGIKAATFIIAPGDDGPLGSITLSKDHATMEHMADISIAVQPSEQAVPLILSSQKSESIGPALRSKRRVTATKRGPDQILESRDHRPKPPRSAREGPAEGRGEVRGEDGACAIPGPPGGRPARSTPSFRVPSLSGPLPFPCQHEPIASFSRQTRGFSPPPITAYHTIHLPLPNHHQPQSRAPLSPNGEARRPFQHDNSTQGTARGPTPRQNITGPHSD
jgi:hypothetical protein